MVYLKYALIAERLTAAPDTEGLLALTGLLEPVFRKTAYLLWNAFSLVMAFSYRHTKTAFPCKCSETATYLPSRDRHHLGHTTASIPFGPVV